MDLHYDDLITRIEEDTTIIATKIEQARGTPNFDSVVFDGMKTLVKAYGTTGYSFNLATEKLIQKAQPIVQDALVRLLDTHLPEALTMFHTTQDIDALFACYYSLSLVYKKTEDIKALERLVNDPRAGSLSGFPLIYEVQSRYYKRIGKLREALKKDQHAINILASSKPPIENYGVCISYASTVCTILEQKSDDVSASEIETAKKYVDKAIEYNPTYAKYYYLKAKLLYLTKLHLDLPEFEEICSAASELLGVAQVKNCTRNYNREKDYEDFDRFECSMQDELKKRKSAIKPVRFQVHSPEEIEAAKQKILHSSSIGEVEKPAMPVLSDGEKYVFICYSAQDYKSVYCDLIELYRHQIPFKYDEKLIPGQRWNLQVENYIKSNDCTGVVFYISQNTLISKGFCEEIQMVCETLQKPYFAVNLEGATPPSRILIDTILKVCKKELAVQPISAQDMLCFLKAFDDELVFTKKYRDYGDQGTQHIADLQESIQRKNRFTTQKGC